MLFTLFVGVTEGGDLVGRCLELPKAISNGKTLQELRRNMSDVISLIQETIHEDAIEDEQAIEVDADM